MIPPDLSPVVRSRVNAYLQQRLDNPAFHSRLFVNEEEQLLGTKMRWSQIAIFRVSNVLDLEDKVYPQVMAMGDFSISFARIELEVGDSRHLARGNIWLIYVDILILSDVSSEI